MTWYVLRDANGAIHTAYVSPPDGLTTEPVADTDAALQAFLNPVPQITPLQALLWLAQKGKSEQNVLDLINGMSDPVQMLQAKAYWTRSDRLHHDNPFIVALWAGLGLSETTEQAFREASVL